MSGTNGHALDVAAIPVELDLGVARDTRPRPCTKRTWCILPEHDGVCVEIPGARQQPPDFGPKR